MPSHRIDATFARLAAAGHSAFVGYITAGDPSLEDTVALAHTLERAGCDILELGIPFSDPIADGLAIQLAIQRALAHGTTPERVLECVAAIRRTSELPIVLFTYYNPVLRMGFETFAARAAAAGADGVLLLDLPPEEADREIALCAQHNLRWIYLIAPTTPDDRIPLLASRSTGFVYYVSREGVTGMQSSVSASVAERVALIRRHAKAPVCVGFGISHADHVRTVATCADGVVVGSAIVTCIERNAADRAAMLAHVEALVAPMAAAAHEPRPQPV